MLLSTLTSRTYRAYVLAAIGIVTVLSILISFHSTVSIGLSTYTYDSSRKELLKTHDTGSQDGSNSQTGAGPNTIKSYRKTTCRSSTWGPEWTVDSNGGVCKHGEIGNNGCCLLASSVPEVRNLNVKPLSMDIRRSPLTINTDKSEEDSNRDGPGADENKRDPFGSPAGELGTEETKSDTTQFGETLVRPTCSIEHQCCAQYEFCVSSCLDFTWQRLHSTTINARSSTDTATGAVLQLIERLVGDHQAEDDSVAQEYSGATDLFDWCLLRCRTSGRSVVHQNSFRSSLKHCYGLKDPPLLARVIEKGETE